MFRSILTCAELFVVGCYVISGVTGTLLWCIHPVHYKPLDVRLIDISLNHIGPPFLLSGGGVMLLVIFPACLSARRLSFPMSRLERYSPIAWLMVFIFQLWFYIRFLSVDSV